MVYINLFSTSKMSTIINYCIVEKHGLYGLSRAPSEAANQRLTGVLAMISSLFAASRADPLFERQTRRGQRFWTAFNDLTDSVTEFSGSSKCTLIDPDVLIEFLNLVVSL